MISFFRKKQIPTEFKFYDGLLGLPIVSPKAGRTIIREKGIYHVAMMSGPTAPVFLDMNAPLDFLKYYYRLTGEVNNGDPLNRIVYVAIVYIDAPTFARLRASQKKRGRKFPRWVWDVVVKNDTDFFVINSYEDNEPQNVNKKFDAFGAFGMQRDGYFWFVAVARTEYVMRVNRWLRS